MPEAFTTSDVARLYSVKTWQVRRLYEDGTLPEPPRLGLQRAIPREQIASIAAALEKRGWLPKQEVSSK